MTDEHSTDRREYQKAWRAANHAKMTAYLAAYYIANRDKLREENARRYKENASSCKRRARKWEMENPERRLELEARYRQRNAERLREMSRKSWQKHKTKRNARKAEYRRERPDLAAHHCRLRQTRKQKATPAWADLTAIKATYKRAAELRKETGEAWHVDHEVPLKHPLVCGLHVHTNLRVIPAADNLSKGNRLTVIAT